MRAKPKGPSRYGTARDRAEQAPSEKPIIRLAECAALLQIHPITLSVWRREGKGPPALNLAGSDRAVRYDRAEVLKWARAQKRPSSNVQGDGGAAQK